VYLPNEIKYVCAPKIEFRLRKLIFMGSKAIGCYCLKNLIERKEELQIEVVALFTNNRKLNDAHESVVSVAEHENIPVYGSLLDLEKHTDVDFIVSVQYHEILKEKHIHKAKRLAINLHMAPLPEYRGCNQFSFAILDSAPTFGTTIHLLDTGIDSGAIIAEKRFAIPQKPNVKYLYELTEKASEELFSETIKDILNGKFTPVEQAHLIPERGTSIHYRNEMNFLKKVDLSWDEEKIDRHIRATYFPPFPPPYASKDGNEIPLSLNWREEIK